MQNRSVSTAPQPSTLPRRTERVAIPPPPCSMVTTVLERGVAERRFLFPDAGSPRRIEQWAPPALNGIAEATAVEHRLAILNDMLQPAPRGPLLARILTLLSHYRSDPHPPEVEQRLADDWADDLGSFPLWAVEEAARTWRRTRRFKPQPAEMINLCEDNCTTFRQERDRLEQITRTRLAEQNPLSQRTAALAHGLLRPIPR